LNGRIATDYVYQHLSAFTNGYAVPADRTKPWGTGHAVLCCKGKVNEPFAVINADDFYGKDAFTKAYTFLTTQCNEQTYCIIGYQLRNTLSDNGTVSRGVCDVDASGNLTDINERTKIFARPEGDIVYEENDQLTVLPENSLVSMNYLCFAPGFIGLAENLFNDFLEKQGQELKSEFYIPTVTKHFVQSGKGVVKVIPTSSQWFGVTYKEDAPGVQASINALVAAGEYPSSLWK
jgi:hypothetical protein